jgi:hypothetical protein
MSPALEPQPLLFYPDYGADPLWADRGSATVSLALLPLTEQTKRAVRAWTSEWHRLALQDLEADSEAVLTEPQAQPSSAHEWRACTDRMTDLIALLRRELQPPWMISQTRWDGRQRLVQWESGTPWQPAPTP